MKKDGSWKKYDQQSSKPQPQIGVILEGANKNFSVAGVTELSMDMFSQPVSNKNFDLDNAFGGEFFMPEVFKK